MVLGKAIKKTVKGIIRWAITDEILKDKENYHNDSMMPASIGSSSTKSMNSSNNITVNGMNFIVYSATGGKVIEFRTYDPRTDRSVNTLYVITDKEDLGEELGQIITKESLCR
jgi:hypothetical protein